MKMCKNKQASTSVMLSGLLLAKYPRPPCYQVPGPLSGPHMTQSFGCIHKKSSRITCTTLNMTQGLESGLCLHLSSPLPALHLSLHAPAFMSFMFFSAWKAFPQSSVTSPFLPFGSVFKCYHSREVFSNLF